MKTVYLLLTRSATLFSRCIRVLTASPYTHVAISVADDPAGCYYSFGRKNPLFPFPAGFIRESRERGYLHRFPRTRCVLLALEISDGAYSSICSRLLKMEASARYYRYNLSGALLCGFGIQWVRRRHYFCSQFIGDLLTRSGAVTLPKPISLMQPIDYAFLPGVRVLFSGAAGELFGNTGRYIVPEDRQIPCTSCNPAGSMVY
ncbi:MAG: hypothetical protein IJB52_11890 [Clostridia bacterium]|nr:hypothetical protein [Clostridia bacterium]